MAVSANNVANSLSNDFKKSRAINTEGRNGHFGGIGDNVGVAELAQAPDRGGPGRPSPHRLHGGGSHRPGDRAGAATARL